MLWHCKLDKKIQSNLRGKQIFVIFNDCQYMLRNVDEITSLPFPVNWVFIQSLTNIEVAFFLLQQFIEVIIELQGLKSS